MDTRLSSGRQAQLRNEVGGSQKGVWKWFAGEAIPRKETIVKLAEKLQVNRIWLEYGVGIKHDEAQCTTDRKNLIELMNQVDAKDEEIVIRILRGIING